MNFKNTSIKGVVLALGMVAVSGCGMLKMPDMMQQTVDGMKETNAKMQNTINGMNKTNAMMDEMCAGQTKVTTSDYRDKLLERIRNEKDIGRKLSLAVKYNYAWEFQGMSIACGRGDPNYLNNVYNESVKEFLESMHTLIGTRSATGATSTDNDMNSLYAIAATLHYVNSLQQQDGDLNGYTPVTMLDLLKNVIEAKVQMKNNKLSVKQIPAYVDSALILEGDMNYMLQLRYNFLSAFSFGLATTNLVGDEATLFGKAKYVIDGMVGRSWSPDFADKNTDQINYYALIMTRALEARGMLEKAGVTPATDGTIYKIYSSLDFSFDTSMNKSDLLSVSEKKEAVLNYQQKVNEYLKATNIVADPAN